MARTLWIVGGRKADGRVLAANISLAYAAKLQRLAEIRVRVVEELGDEADDRALANETRKRWREADIEAHKLDAELRKVGKASRKASRELAKPIYAYVQPYGGGRISEREIKRFDSMFHSDRTFGRKPDGLFSFHCKFTSRGFGDRRKDRSRVYKPGEAVKHLRYIIRALAREIAEGGLVSNISLDPDELAGFFAALEELETHDRDNANVYMSLVISLPHELTPEGRERVLGEICELLGEQGLPHVGVLHAPDPRGDQRNFHTHIMFSLRPCEIEAPGRYVFSPDKYSDINDETFIYPFRLKVAAIFNAAMERENHARRFTGLSDSDRGLEPRPKVSGKSTPGKKHYERKQKDLAAMQRERALVFRRGAAIDRLSARLATLMAEPARDRQQEIATRRSTALANLRRMKSSIAQGASDRAERLETMATATLAAGRISLASLNARLTAAMPVRQSIAPTGVGKSLAGTPLTPGQASVAATAPSALTLPVARTQPAGREPRGTERRKSLAAAAWRLHHSSLPPQIRVGDRFAIERKAVSKFVNVNRFEAEDLIQTIHARKHARMLAAVRRVVEGVERSPFTAGESGSDLDVKIFSTALRAAVEAARNDSDLRDLVDQLRLFWRQRDKVRAEAESLKAREKKERIDRLRPHVDRILNDAERQVATGNWPRAKYEEIRPQVETIAAAVAEGRLVMRPMGNAMVAFAASKGLRIIADDLRASHPGHVILVALGGLTHWEPFEQGELPVSWTLPLSFPQQSLGQAHVADAGRAAARGKDGPER